jgi:HSP20 family protein
MAKREKEGNGSKLAVHRSSQALMPRPAESSHQIGWSEHPLRWLRGEMDSLFDRFFGRWPATMEAGWDQERFWDVDVEEADDEIVVRAEAPGFEPKEFDVHVSGNALNIKAEHKEENEDKKEGFHRWEGRYAQFQRSIPLSTAVNADRVDARYHNGVLEVHLPRTEPNPRRRIEVKS